MNAKTRTLFAILLTVCMLVSGMPFAASAEDEPATPTDLAPVEQETPAENGTGENGETTNEEIPAGEIPADEQDNPEEAGSQKEDGSQEEAGGEEETGTDKEEEKEVRLPELHFGGNGYRGTLKAGEEFRIVMRPEYSRNILVTLELTPRGGNAPDAGEVRMTLNGEKKNPVRIENEDPESRGITLQFSTYAAKDNEYILAITSPADADFILTAVKKPEKTDDEDENEKETTAEETTEAGDGNEGGDTPAEAAEGGVTAEDETAGEAEEPAGEETAGEKVSGEEETDGEEADGEEADGEETDGEEETKVENADESGETPADGAAGEAAAEPGTAAEAEEPQAEPVKNEPATPTDLAPASETQDQPAGANTKADSKKETKEKKEEDTAALPPAEELLALGYYGSQVAMTNGADIFESMAEDAEPAAHLEPGTELWLRTTENEAWAEIYRTDEKARGQYIRWDDVIIILKPEPEGEEEEEEPLPARSVEVTSTLWDMLSIPFGTEITMTGELVNFREDDICTFQWQYRTEDSDTFTDIDGANEQTYTYHINKENYYYIWRLTVLVTREE